MPKDILQYLSEDFNSYSKGQKLIAGYIISHYDKAAYMTASRLGAAVGVSESTVVRFASEIGYEGYPELVQALQKMLRNKLTAVQRMEMTSEQFGTGDLLEKVLNFDIEKIKSTLEETSREEFSRAVKSIAGARRLYIVGVRSAMSLAEFMGFYLNLIFENVKVISAASESEMFEQILRINSQDVIVGISFPRYSKRTVSALAYAKNAGAHVVALTDNETSPLTRLADEVLYAHSDMASFIDSLVAPLSLINALIVAVGLYKREEVVSTLAKLENIWDEYKVYEKSGESDDVEL